MARENRYAPTRSDLKVTDRPTEQSHVYAQEIAHQKSAGAGLEGLSDVFSGFFTSLSKAADSMDKAQRTVDAADIKRENTHQAQQGSADALAGKPIDPKLSGDYDYTDAHTKTAGILHGDKLATDWEAYVRTLPVTANVTAEQERWVKEQVRSGSGDPIFDSHLLATFKQKADVINATFRANQFKSFEAKAQSDFGQEIAAKTATGESTGDDLQDWMSRSTPLFHGDLVKSRAFVLSQMAASARTPKALAKLDAMLHAPGYDENGRSFSELFPAAAAQVSDEATDKYIRSTAATGFLAFKDVGDKLHQMEMSGDLDGIARLLGPQGELAQINSKYGAEPQYQGLVTKAWSALSKLGAEQVGFNQYLSVARGESLLVDQSNINKFQLKALQRSGVDPLRSPAEATVAAAHVKSARGISDVLKATMSGALTDKTNPAAQANAYTFWRSLEATGFDVDTAMSKDARAGYGALFYASRGSSIEAAITRINANKALTEQPKDAAAFKWAELTKQTGTPDSQVYASQYDSVKRDIAKTFDVTGLFGLSSSEKLAMDESVKNEVMSLYARSMVEFRDAGNGNYSDDARAWTMRAIAADYLTVPAANGSVRLMRKESLPKQVPVTDIDYSDGKRTTTLRDAIGPGKYKNNGIEENTVETFKADMKRLNQAAPFIFKDPSEFYAGYDARLTPQTGRFVLYDSHTNQPVMFEPGQTVSIEGSTLKGEPTRGIVTIPTDPKDALEFIESRLPKEFKVETGPYGGLQVTYAYRLTGQPSMRDLGAAWDLKQRGSIRETLSPEAKEAYDARSVWMEQFKKSNTGNAMQPSAPEPEAELPSDPYWRAHEVARRQRKQFFDNYGLKGK